MLPVVSDLIRLDRQTPPMIVAARPNSGKSLGDRGWGLGVSTQSLIPIP